MKNTIKITIFSFTFLLFLLGFGQTQSNKKTKHIASNEKVSCDELLFKNMELLMNFELSEQAYKDLLEKNQHLKHALMQYQKAVDQYSLYCSTNTLTNSIDTQLEKESFLEQIIPASRMEKITLTYFILKTGLSAGINIYDDSNVLVRDYAITEAGYGQVVLEANFLKPGIYNCCLKLENKTYDCKKLIVLN